MARQTLPAPHTERWLRSAIPSVRKQRIWATLTVSRCWASDSCVPLLRPLCSKKAPPRLVVAVRIELRLAGYTTRGKQIRSVLFDLALTHPKWPIVSEPDAPGHDD